MGDENFRKYPVNFLLAGLFITCIIFWAIGIAGNYGYGPEFIENNYTDFAGITGEINGSGTNATEWGRTFDLDDPDVESGALTFESLWRIRGLMWGMVRNIYTLTMGGISNTLGLPQAVTQVITAILGISLILAAWRLIKRGD